MKSGNNVCVGCICHHMHFGGFYFVDVIHSGSKRRRSRHKNFMLCKQDDDEGENSANNFIQFWCCLSSVVAFTVMAKNMYTLATLWCKFYINILLESFKWISLSQLMSMSKRSYSAQKQKLSSLTNREIQMNHWTVKWNARKFTERSRGSLEPSRSGK